MMEYPYYMRSQGSCVKVNSATDLWEITLPPDEIVSCRHHKVFGTEKAQKDYLSVFQPSDKNTFMTFLFSFYNRVAEEKEKATK